MIVAFNSHSQFDSELVIASKPTVGIHNFITADLDGDGDLDLLTASRYDNRIAWNENIGNGEFIPRKDISQNFIYAFDVTAADLDNDGDLDVIASSTVGDRVSWFENYGNGEFGVEQVVDAFADAAQSVVALDVDSDGDLDIVSACVDVDQIRWYENIGGIFGSFQILANITGTFMRLQVLDIDNDSDLDLISLSSNNDVALHENENGTIAFPVSLVSTITNFNNVDIVDVDGDLLLDIVIPQFGDVVWFKNLGSNNFQSSQLLTSLFINPRVIRCVDMDGDSDLDVLGISHDPPEILWCENTGGLNFSIEHILGTNTSNSSVYTIKTLDFDNSNGLDILWSDSDGDFIELLRNNGNGTFQDGVRLTAVVAPKKPIFIDVNNDGLDDVVTIDENYYLRWIQNLGGNNFSPTKAITPNILGGNIMFAADMNGDNFKDIVFFDAVGDDVSWIQNNGDGTFGGTELIEGSVGAVSGIDQADYDNDGDLDLLISSSGYMEDTKWYANLGGGNYASGVSLPFFSGENHAKFSNMNSDGLIDIVVASEYYLKWIDYTGAGENILNGNFRLVETGDFDNDNDDDLVYVYENNDIYFAINIGGGTFGTPIFIKNQNIATISLTDIDLDGDLDLLTASYFDAVCEWHENIAGIFAPQTVLQSEATNSATAVDLDQDGDCDILMSTSIGATYSGKLSLLVNGTFNPYQASGIIYVDENQNGIKDGQEVGFNLAPVTSNPISTISYTSAEGNYFINFDVTNPSIYQIAPSFLNNWAITSDSSNYSLFVDYTFTSVDSLDFGIFPSIIMDSTRSEITGAFPRCNTIINQWIEITNTGTTIPSGVINLNLDPQLTFASSSIIPDSIVGNVVYWHFDSLFYFNNTTIGYQVLMPDFQSMGDTITSYLTAITTDGLGLSIFESQDTLKQVLVCAYDPNDKTVEPKGEGIEGFIPSTTDYLDYTIRFQNTGNDTAVVVRIVDQLDPNLLWTTITPLASSHPMQFEYQPDGLIEFIFNDIYLPDSTVDFLGSQGFAKFRIKMIQGLAPLTEIKNTALIYFDQNSAVETNTILNTIESNSIGLSELFSDETISIYPNPFSSILTINSFDLDMDKICLYSILGNLVYDSNVLNSNKVDLNLSELPSGTYLLNCKTISGTSFNRRIIKY